MNVPGTFDDLAEEYERYRLGYSVELFDELTALGFTAGKAVIDVGCGTGLASEPLALRGMHVTGVDPSETMLARARRRLPAATFVPGTAEALPFEQRTFDGVVSAQTLHWTDQRAALREMIRVVRPGGSVAVWWKVLGADDDMRAFRGAATSKLGLPEAAEPLRGGFGAFYSAPFTERVLRAVPTVARFTVEAWLGYERSRAAARNAYGARRDDYLAALGSELRAVFPDPAARFEVRYLQYLYVGRVGT